MPEDAASPTLPNALLRALARNLSPAATQLFLVVFAHTRAHNRNAAQISYQTIIEESNIKSNYLVSKSIKELQHAGLIFHAAPFTSQTRQETGTFTLNTEGIREFSRIPCAKNSTQPHQKIRENNHSSKERARCDSTPNLGPWKNHLSETEMFPHDYD